MRTPEMIELTIANDDALRNGYSRTPEMRALSNLRNACDIFSQTYFHNIREIHEKSDDRGHTAIYKDLKIMTYCMAGRIMVTVKNKNEDSITLVGGEDKADGIAGLHTIDCEPDVALDMLELLTQEWYNVYDKRGVNNVNEFKVDKKLSIA